MEKKKAGRDLLITDPCYIPKTDGLSFLVNRSTLYGDWSCFCYKTGDRAEAEKWNSEWWEKYTEFFRKYNFSGLSDEEKKKLSSEHEAAKAEVVRNRCWGEFCADSGEVCCAWLDDVLKLNPDFRKWMDEHPWCAAVVPGFDGSVEEVVDGEGDEASLILVGRSDAAPFVTMQCGF